MPVINIFISDKKAGQILIMTWVKNTDRFIKTSPQVKMKTPITMAMAKMMAIKIPEMTKKHFNNMKDFINGIVVTW